MSRARHFTGICLRKSKPTQTIQNNPKVLKINNAFENIEDKKAFSAGCA